MTKSASQILFDAADVLNERGLCKGKFYDEQGRVCSLGALAVAVRGKRPPAYWDATVALESEISRRVGGYYLTISQFNDEATLSGRKVSKRQVVAVFRAAARNLRKRGL